MRWMKQTNQTNQLRPIVLFNHHFFCMVISVRSVLFSDNKKKLNVGNLPNDVTEEELREHFADHPVESVEIFHFKQYTLALLLFKDKETATKALKEKENSVFRGRRLRMHLEYIVICHMKKDVFVYVVDNESKFLLLPTKPICLFFFLQVFNTL